MTGDNGGELEVDAGEVFVQESAIRSGSVQTGIVAPALDESRFVVAIPHIGRATCMPPGCDDSVRVSRHRVQVRPDFASRTLLNFREQSTYSARRARGMWKKMTPFLAGPSGDRKHVTGVGPSNPEPWKSALDSAREKKKSRCASDCGARRRIGRWNPNEDPVSSNRPAFLRFRGSRRRRRSPFSTRLFPRGRSRELSSRHH